MSNKIQIPVSILPGILFFIAAQLCVHLSYCLLVWFMALFSGYLFKVNAHQQFNFAVAVWLTGIGAAVSANQYYFPHSKFAELSSLILVTPVITHCALILLSFVFCTIFLASLTGFLAWLIDKSLNYALLLMLVFAAASWIVLNHTVPLPVHVKKNVRPHVFIIGVDSLRPDFLGFFGASHATPFLDGILRQSTVFSEAVTPLARTFPSWVSILMGQHPLQSGIRTNLANVDNINFSNSLPALFKQQGYETLYATDETRFSNIDLRLGFDEVISPPVGLNDFLLGTFNDFPLSNLLVNTTLGHWLFPYSYANRPAIHTYDPDSFVELMRPSIMKSHEQPLFMAVHFCLPHFPYIWASSPSGSFNPQDLYQASVVRVDQQINTFVTMLKNAHLLDHAVVVLLSDHGEALELSGDRITEGSKYLGKLTKAGQPPRFYPPSLDDEAVNQSAGHGTDVLGLTQYHTLLAFKLFGMGEQRVGEVGGVVPLSDIKQTLLSLAEIKQKPSIKAPLASIVRGQLRNAPLQHVLIESDYSPESIHTVYPETRKVMLEGVQLYQINPTSTRLTIKDEMGKMIIRSKQYADIFSGWMLALYPQSYSSHMPILINLKTGRWTNNLQSDFARHSPVIAMQAQLKSFYGIELEDI